MRAFTLKLGQMKEQQETDFYQVLMPQELWHKLGSWSKDIELLIFSTHDCIERGRTKPTLRHDGEVQWWLYTFTSVSQTTQPN